jgi:hypothetical protein
MSRSHRRYPFSYFVGGESQAEWKRSYNRYLRRSVKYLVALRGDDDDLILPILDEVANPWSSPRDGSGRYAPFRLGEYRWTRDVQVPARFAHYKATLMK